MTSQVIGFIGDSGSGKTTLIVQIVACLVEDARNVSVIKHTHHGASLTRRGDTELFLAAGARTSWLCAADSSTRFTAGDISVHSLHDPDSLIDSLDDDLIIVEGFRDRGEWPRLLVIGNDGTSRESDGPFIVAIVSDHPRAAGLCPLLPHFGRGEVRTIASFVDRISGS